MMSVKVLDALQECAWIGYLSERMFQHVAIVPCTLQLFRNMPHLGKLLVGKNDLAGRVPYQDAVNRSFCLRLKQGRLEQELLGFAFFLCQIVLDGDKVTVPLPSSTGAILISSG